MPNAGSNTEFAFIAMNSWQHNNEIRKLLIPMSNHAKMSFRLNFDIETFGTAAARAFGASGCNEIQVIREGGLDYFV